MRKFIIGLASLAAIAAVPAHAAVTVFQEDFENGLGTFAPTGSVTTASGAQYVALAGSGFTGTGASLTNHFAAFAGGNGQPNPGANPTFGTLLSTTISTVAGTLYTIGFDYGAIGSPGNSTQSFFFNATNGFTLVASASFAPLVASNNLDTLFTRYQTQFVGNGSSVALQFVASGGFNDNADALLDNVLVRAGPVPETTTWAMMVLGLGTVGGMMRRARRIRAQGGLAHA